MVKQKENGMYGYVMRGKATSPAVSAFLPCFWGYGADMFDSNWMPQFTSDKSVAALEFWVQMSKEVAPPGAAAFDSTEVTNSLKGGESAQPLVWPSWAGDLDGAAGRISADTHQRLHGPGCPQEIPVLQQPVSEPPGCPSAATDHELEPIEDAFGTQISSALAGEVSAKDALQNVQQTATDAMKKEGYLK
jgi:ABC-type glycerol-3-phosphate transport system substrate-binding protein